MKHNYFEMRENDPLQLNIFQNKNVSGGQICAKCIKKNELASFYIVLSIIIEYLFNFLFLLVAGNAGIFINMQFSRKNLN